MPPEVDYFCPEEWEKGACQRPPSGFVAQIRSGGKNSLKCRHPANLDLIKVTGYWIVKSIRNEEASFSVGDPTENWKTETAFSQFFSWKSKNMVFVNYLQAF